MTLGIIGTAGRGTDRAQLSPGVYRSMLTVARVVCTLTRPAALVSGGAAYSDHLAVKLFLENLAPKLTLHLPAEFTAFGFRESDRSVGSDGSGFRSPGKVSNYYHRLFSDDQGFDSLAEIQQAIEHGAVIKTGAGGTGGFKARNTDIANDADVLLAFTFGDGPALKDGGTKDTMDKFLARRIAPGWPMAIAQEALRAYHFDLNDRRLYSL